MSHADPRTFILVKDFTHLESLKIIGLDAFLHKCTALRAVTVAVQEGHLTTGAVAFSRGTQLQTTRSFAGREMED